jgi:glyoxylase-like metal-dependent hydrolase (beta-lactamase superfamily II)
MFGTAGEGDDARVGSINPQEYDMTLQSLRLPKASRHSALESFDPAPSRYTHQVGDIAVTILSDGVLPLPAATLASNAKPAELSAWLGARLLPDDVFTWALNTIVVHSGDRTILIDAGIGQEYPELPAGRLAMRLAAAGIELASISDVVLTHLHIDHVGGLLSDEIKCGLRPDVPVHLAAAEIAFWEAPDFSRTAMPEPMPDMIREAARRFLDQYRSRLRPFESAREVAPGVLVVRTGGHTPGHSVVRLASGKERLTFLGDAVFPDHFERPDWYNAFDHDPEEAVRVRRQLLHDLAITGEPLVATHVSFPSLGRVSLTGDTFRWVPSDWAF